MPTKRPSLRPTTSSFYCDPFAANDTIHTSTCIFYACPGKNSFFVIYLLTIISQHRCSANEGSIIQLLRWSGQPRFQLQDSLGYTELFGSLPYDSTTRQYSYTIGTYGNVYYKCQTFTLIEGCTYTYEGSTSCNGTIRIIEGSLRSIYSIVI